ncbi:MAG: hypothetical protein JKY17_03795 [Magnetovibrio sp.]|nr:hypothetical protein [Magnetovibrio sp.]
MNPLFNDINSGEGYQEVVEELIATVEPIAGVSTRQTNSSLHCYLKP